MYVRGLREDNKYEEDRGILDMGWMEELIIEYSSSW